MKQNSSRIFLIICLLILISLACKAPFLSQLLPDTSTSTDTSVSTGDDVSSSSDSSDDVSTSSDSGVDTPHNTDGADVTFIPGATFQMGSPTTDTLADEDELPQHQVTVNEFHIYTYEVTNQMYGACVDAGYCLSPYILEDGPTSHFEDPDYQEYPVVGVDWVMARDYCSWAGARLPTEAEWELASRGPDSLYYPWGEEDPTCEYVNMKGCYTPPDTQEVGYYLMGNSPDEVWDMSGNVWEWVHDWYGEDYYSVSPEDNPIGPLEPADPDKPLRGIRGGGLNSSPDKMRSASRKGLNPYRVFTDVGFRCVVGEGLLFPAEYDHGDDRHERVPPDSADGGDSADDDGFDREFFWAGPTDGPCPDPFGDFTLTFRAGASIPVDNVYAWISDFPFDMDCDYDPIAEFVSCTGGEFAGYLEIPPPSTPILICFEHTEGTDCIEVPIWKPTDCEREEGRYEIETECIDIEGSLTPVITFGFWGSGEDFSFATADGALLTCLYDLGLERYHCSPLPGGYPSDLEFVVSFDDGTTWSTTVPFPDCDETLDFTTPWNLVLGTCTIPPGHPAQYDLFIDTHVEGVADADWIGWELDGVVPPQNCAPAQPPEGRWDCSFAVADYTGVSIEFCAKWPDNPAGRCVTFTDIDDYLPPHDSPECSPPEDHGDEPGSGYCIEETPGSCGSNPCRPSCEASGPNETCTSCTIP